MSVPGPTVLRLDAQNPWPGPREFTEGNAEFFHGRDDEREELLGRVQARPVTVLYGKSGLGKSSLLQAGLFRPLRELDGLPILCKLHYDSPEHPVAEQVRRALVDAYAEAGLAGPRDGECAWEFLHRRDGLPRRPVGAGEKVVEPCPVLVFDQFEELFTRGAEGADASKQADLAITFLAELIENRTPEPLRAAMKENPLFARELRFGGPYYKVVVTLREDYLAHLERLTSVIPALAQNRMTLSPMNGVTALDAARPAGTTLVSEEVAQKIVRFVAGADGAGGEKTEPLENLRIDPWLLCLLCYELNLERQHDAAPQITLDLLNRSRQDIVKNFYERCVGKDPAIDHFIEDVLVTEPGTRDRVTMDRAESLLPAETITRLVKDRLLRVEDWDVRYVLLAHDILVPVAVARRRERKMREAARKRQWLYVRSAVYVLAALAVLALILWGWNYRSREATAEHGEDMAQHSEAEKAILLSRVYSTVAIQNFERGEPRFTAMYLARALKAQHNSLGRRNPEVDSLAHDFLFRQDRPFDQVMDGLRTLPTQKEILSVCFSPDQSLVATTTTDCRVCLWRADDGRMVGKAMVHPQKVHSAAFSPGGRFLVTACEDGKVRVWDTKTQAKAQDPKDEWVPSAANAVPDGQVVRSVRFRPTANGKAGPDETLDDLPPFVVSCWDGNVSVRNARKMVNTARHPPMGSLPLGGGPRPPSANKQALWCTNASYSADGRLVVAAYGDYTARIWEFPSEAAGAGDPPEPRLVGNVPHDDWVLSAEFSPDGRQLLTASADGSARVWEVEPDGKIPSQTPEHILEHPGGIVYAAAFSPPQQERRIIATACADGIVRLWDAEDGRRLLELPLHGGAVRTIAFSKDGRQLVSGSVDGTACVWPNPYASGPGSSRHGTVPSRQLLTEQGDVTALAYAPDGRTIATGTCDGKVDLWDAETLKNICPGNAQHEAEVYAVSFRGDGQRLVSASEDHTVRQWNIEREAGPVRLRAAIIITNPSKGSFRSAAFEPRNPYRRLLTASDDGNACLWDAETGKQIGLPLGVSSPAGTGKEAMKTHVGTVHSAAFSPDGRYVVTAGGDKLAQVFDTAGGQPVPPLQLKHESSVFAAVFSPDGKEVLTACDDGRARLWSAAGGTKPTSTLLCGSRVQSASFTPDGAGVLTACANGSLQLWSDTTALSETRNPPSAVAARRPPRGNELYQELVFPLCHDSGLVCAAVRPGASGQLLAVTQDHKVKCWRIASAYQPPTPSDAADTALLGLLEAIGNDKVDEEEERAPLSTDEAIRDHWGDVKKAMKW